MRKPPPRPEPGLIGLNIANPSELFHAFDPSPLVSRDLNDEVEQYILESALEAPRSHYQLVLHAPSGTIDAPEVAQIPDAIRQYFHYKLEVYEMHLRLAMQDGRRSLLTGVLFLLACWGLGLIAMDFVPEPYGDFFREGFLIIGWVANWKPIHFFLYERQPLLRRRKILRSLSEMDIEIRPAVSATAPGRVPHPETINRMPGTSEP